MQSVKKTMGLLIVGGATYFAGNMLWAASSDSDSIGTTPPPPVSSPAPTTSPGMNAGTTGTSGTSGTGETETMGTEGSASDKLTTTLGKCTTKGKTMNASSHAECLRLGGTWKSPSPETTGTKGTTSGPAHESHTGDSSGTGTSTSDGDSLRPSGGASSGSDSSGSDSSGSGSGGGSTY